MQIVCPNCATAYDVQPASLGADGRSVRCVRCRNVWFASPTPEPVAHMAADATRATPDGPAAVDQPWAAEGKPSGEFEWSLEQAEATSEATPSQPKEQAAAPAADDAQSVDDAAWSLADKEEVAEAEAPSLVPAIEPDPEPVVEERAEPDNVETVAARRAPKKAKRVSWKVKLPRPGMPAVIVALAATLAGLFIWRGEVVRALPQTASLFGAVGLPVNLRGLVFENVKTTGEVVDGVPVLIVEGTIVNIVNATVEVPRLRFALRNRAGHEVYAWTSVTGRSVLAPGETAAFRTRLASPPTDGRDVVVRFFTRRDFRAGMR
jgi:predicted Zn finger-like uncharacterized protein